MVSVSAKKVFKKISCLCTFKDIVQPKKRGVKRGTNRFVSTSYAISDIL
jgi:hypothetical protein